ncbi:Rpn family recombination-promoting nuclease/putative transposase [Persicobacter psychrovividus]|uniref:Rpn family recombination-promoting nuclease/putative transposase n=1 Tax=Persicobacter psychrovividus TaxID=387638 RepID=A0ABN6L6K5_9BACT|nr:hypothetical protein PEPS_07590 [Persicobacter psychrovividus]
MLSKFINPFTDFGFKKLFGEEANKDLLIDFLNQLLPEEDQIKELSYQNNEHLPRTPEERKAIFDLFCQNEAGETFIIELQRAKQKYFKDRSLYYSTFPIQEQAEPGKDWKFKLKSVYTIGIMDFVFDEKDENKDKLLHHVQLLETETKEVFYDKLTFIYLETPKFTKELHELESKFDKWLYLLRNLEKLQDRPAQLQERIFTKFFDNAEIAHYTPVERKAYEASLKVYRDLFNVIETAKSEAEKIGIEKGAQNEKNEFIKSLIQMNVLSDAQIAQSARVTEDQVKKIRKDLNL